MSHGAKSEPRGRRSRSAQSVQNKAKSGTGPGQLTDPGPVSDPEGDGRTRSVPAQSGHFGTRTRGRPTRPDGPEDDAEPDDQALVEDDAEPDDQALVEDDAEPADESGHTAEPAVADRRNLSGLFVAVVLVLVVIGLVTAVRGSGLVAPAPGHQRTLQARLPGPAPTMVGVAGPKPTPSPSAPTVVDQGAGTFTQVQSEGPVLGTAGVLRRFRVAVEDGIAESPNAFAATVDQVLGDPRSWIAGGQFRLQRVPGSAPAEFTIFLASPTTSQAMCAVGGLQTDKFTSCRLPGQVIINDARWLTAIPDYGASLDVYRAYAVNHEVGHQLGYGHEACVGAGQPAPVMQQQTYGLNGCTANAWPYLNGQRYAGPPVP